MPRSPSRQPSTEPDPAPDTTSGNPTDAPGRVHAACADLADLAGPSAFSLFHQGALRELYERGLFALIGRAAAQAA